MNNDDLIDSTLATFFWTNIMAWDIYKTFGQRTLLSHIRNFSMLEYKKCSK